MSATFIFVSFGCGASIAAFYSAILGDWPAVVMYGLIAIGCIAWAVGERLAGEIRMLRVVVENIKKEKEKDT
jgi:hypothetical protein